MKQIAPDGYFEVRINKAGHNTFTVELTKRVAGHKIKTVSVPIEKKDLVMTLEQLHALADTAEGT